MKIRCDSIDEKYMKMAIALAKKGIGKTNPNPAVGAILVKNGKVIASGYHKKAGLSHAEVIAIEKAGRKSRGATLYCTLEACTHYGKTPPCVDAIIKSGIKRAVFAMKDPNPINYGRGIAKLKKAGIVTKCNVLKKETQDLNRPFIKFMREHQPYVTLKMAQSLDGKIADAKGRSKYISSKPSRRFVHRMRAQNDAVMIGINTLIKDNPLLTDRTHKQIAKQPLRVVVDTNLRTPLKTRMLKDNGRGEVLVVGGEGALLKKKADLEKNGARVILLPRKGNRVDLKCLMSYLADLGVMSVLCEGGGELAASLLRDKLVDELFFFVSLRIIGGRDSPTSCGGLDSDIRDSIRFKTAGIKRIGEDILIRGFV